MTDLETYFYDVAEGRVRSFSWEPTAADEWEIQATIAATQKIAVVSIEASFRSSRQGVAGADTTGFDFCLSSGADDAGVTADSNKIVLFEHLQALNVIDAIYLDFKGCPVMGLSGQSIHLQGHTTTNAIKPTAIVHYMVIPI